MAGQLSLSLPLTMEDEYSWLPLSLAHLRYGQQTFTLNKDMQNGSVECNKYHDSHTYSWLHISLAHLLTMQAIVPFPKLLGWSVLGTKDHGTMDEHLPLLQLYLTFPLWGCRFYALEFGIHKHFWLKLATLSELMLVALIYWQHTTLGIASGVPLLCN